MIRTIAVAVLALLAACAAPAPRQFTVFFGTGSDRLTREAQEIVSQAAAAAHEQGGSKLVVAGYGDGESAEDAALGDRRAIAVLQALVEDGVDASRIGRRPGAAEATGAGMPVHKATVTIETP